MTIYFMKVFDKMHDKRMHAKHNFFENARNT